MSAFEGIYGGHREAVDVRAYLRPLWRWRLVVLAIALIAGGATYALTLREHKTYVARTRVYVQNADPVASITSSAPTGTPSQQSLQDIATLFTSQAIVAAVYRQLHLPVGSAGSVAATVEPNASFVDVTASSRSPAFAARLANTYARVFLSSQAASVAAAARSDANAEMSTLNLIPTSGAANEAQRSALLAQIATYDTIARNPSAGAQQVDSAIAPTAPASPKPVRDAVIAALIGLLVGIGLAYLLDLFDRRIVRVAAVQSLYGRAVLAVLPHVSRSANRSNGHPATPGEFVEAMRGLRVNLRLAGGRRAPQSVLVTSALPSEGKSTVVRDLAFAYADAGERVLLIDCDLRRPSLSLTFGVEPQFGLAHVLRGEATVLNAAVPVFRTDVAGQSANTSSNGAPRAGGARNDPRASGVINLIGHGEIIESPVALLSSRGMKGVLATSGSFYDVVILDTPPVLAVSDAVPLLDQVDAVLFVARLRMTTRDAAQRLAGLSQRVTGMHLVGIVVNDVRHSYLDEGYGGYGHYSDGADARTTAPSRT